MKKKLVIFLTIVAFIYLYFPVIFPTSQPVSTYSMVPDSEGEYLTTLRMSQGQGWYSSFSYVYPPGKFMLRAFLFRLIGPTFATMGLPMLATTWLVFPSVLFVLCLVFSQQLFALIYPRIHHSVQFVLSYLLAVGSVFVYLAFFRSAQEVHVLVALFFLTLLSADEAKLRTKYCLGVLLGLTFLFRIDVGILLSLAFLVSLLPHLLTFRQSARELSNVVLGGMTIWIPVIAVISFHGSLSNFLYDTLVLGLIVQPRFMSLPIPDNQFGLFYLSTLIFLLGGSVGMFLFSRYESDRTRQLALRVLSLMSILSYVAVLGRSDESHLWYGLIWLPVITLFYMIKLSTFCTQRVRISVSSILSTIAIAVMIYLFCRQVLFFKNPTLFLVEITGLFVFFHFSFFKKISINQVLLAGMCTSLIVFHSMSFFKLKLLFPRPPVRTVISFDWLQNDPGEVGGLVIDQQSAVVLDQIRADIPQQERYLFIFPKNIFLSEYFHLTSPTRYTLISLERSDATEREIISNLQETNTQYVLVFPQSAVLRDGPVWHWILAYTQPTKTYMLGTEPVELRKKVDTASNDPDYWVKKY